MRLLERLPQDVLRVIERLHQAGFGVWLVGGALRDLLLGGVPKDWDLGTDADSPTVTGLFRRTVPIGIRHGTVQVRTELRGVEVTSVAGRGAEGLLADLERRDFTMNALALSYPEGRLWDPWGGEQDLADGIVRAVGEAALRFREDPLRTLRAGRFVSVYGFRLEEGTFRALRAEAGGLDRIARERIRDEMMKTLLGHHAPRGLQVLSQGGVLARVLPELETDFAKTEKSVPSAGAFRTTLETLESCPFRLRVRLAALFHCLAGRQRPTGVLDFRKQARESASMAERIMDRWRAPRRETRDVVALLSNQLPPGLEEWKDVELREWIASAGIDLVPDLLDLGEAQCRGWRVGEAALDQLRAFRRRVGEQLERRFPLRVSDLAISGGDVMKALGLPSGPAVGRILQELHEAVLREPELNEHKILMDFLGKAYHK
jgi:tRNA nucleotidyltransferase (CCA-adding enzyme)